MLMKVKCVVSCRSADGTPDFYPCVVEVTDEQYDEGDHYEWARDAAIDAGYESPKIVHDENDGPDWLFAQFDWSEAAQVVQGGD